MFKMHRNKALQDSTSSRNLANEFINEQGSCTTLSVLKVNASEISPYHYNVQ